MTAPSTLGRAFWPSLSVAAWVFALFIALDTSRAVVPLWSPLPWFDEWATVRLIRAWQDGDMGAAEMLFSQHNEHRILVPRLVFFADDLLFRGGGGLSLASIFAVQVLHAGVFAAVLARSRPARPGRSAVAAVVLALMFSLRQAENFSSGFQLQFVAVFAGATLGLVLFGLAASRERAGRPAAPALAAAFAAAAVTAFTMANGLAVAYVMAALAISARLRARTVLACAVVALALTAVYLHGYEAVPHHGSPADSLRHPVRLLVYVATYLGDVAALGTIGRPAALGLIGMALTAWAAFRTLGRGGARPGPLAMVGVMLFVGVTAAITASGRLELGVVQALSSRYVTGSAAFWAAQLTYWWIDPPGGAVRVGGRSVPAGAFGRAGVAAVAALLALAVAGEQGHDKPQLAVQSFAQNEAADALMLGFHDPAAMARVSWPDDDLATVADILQRDGLSVFGTPEAAAVGGPVSALGTPLSPDPCGGTLEVAAADPSLGRDGVRVSGTARDGPAGRGIRRILLADDRGRLVGFASGAIPGGGREAWRGYAAAAPGARLTAWGRVGSASLCRVGDATVSAGTAAEAGRAP